MTFVIDPLGTPEPHFVKDGEALLRLVGGAAPSTYTQIPAVAGKTIVIAESPNPGTPGDMGLFEAAAGFEIGEVIEVYAASDFAFTVRLPSGDVLVGDGSTSIAGSLAQSIRLQKVSASEWIWART